MQVVSPANFIFLFLTDSMVDDIVAKNYSISKMQKRKENFKRKVTSNLPPNKFTKALALLVYSKGGGLGGFRHATSVASIKRPFEDRIIAAARRGAARWSMHRCNYAALLSRLSVPTEYTKRKGRCESSSRCSLLLAGIGRCDISPLCLIIRRQSDGESRFDSTLLRSFDLFRRLISCFVEDVVVAISFASRGAWATSSMKWTTCHSYDIWFTK